MKKSLLLAFFAVTASSAFAQLNITTNTTWSTDQILTQSVVVSPGATLTIEEGVRVLPIFIDVDNNNVGDIYIEINGSLIVSGSPCNKVRFEPFEETTNK